MKRIMAIAAAAVITLIVGLGMLVVGVNAIFNPNSIPVSNSPAEAAAVSNAPASTATDANAQAQIAQLQSLVNQYQNREKQYQAQVNDLNSQLQNAQSILTELQRRGIIRIGANGSVQLRQGR